MKSTLLLFATFLSISAFAIPNPASVNCKQKGGRLEIIDGKDGQYGLCAFGKGKIEEWTLLRANNGKAQEAVMKLKYARVMAKDATIKCSKLNGTVIVDKTSDGSDISVCRFKDGSVIEANTLFLGSAVNSNKALMKALK
jgi:putative hemolysin